MASKKPQLRKCAVCHVAGHNKATCPTLKPLPSARPAAAPLKFFVHHVNVPPPTSPHVVNLKTEQHDIWKTVESAAPEVTIENLFQSYHTKRQTETPTISPKLFSDLSRPQLPFFPSHLHHEETEAEAQGSELKPVFVSATDKPHAAKIKILSKLEPATRVALAAVLILGIIFVAPGPVRGYYQSLTAAKTSVVENSTAGFMALQESTGALKSINLPAAEAATNNALSKFNAALTTLDKEHTVLQAVVGAVPFLHGEVQSREKVLLAGQEIAVGNSYLIAALREIQETSSTPLTAKMQRLVVSLRAANPNYEQALSNLDSVDLKTLPLQYQEQFKDFRTLFGGLVTDFKHIAELNDTLQEIFGGKGERRYLLVFQNPAELRATGGFMGSFAVLDVKDGAIVKLDIPAGGTYDLQGQLPDYVIPPLPLTLTNKRWEFQDANWFPDFPASAEKMLWFFNRSRGVTADGVIAINASVLERLLGIVGPVADSSRSLTLSSENALTTIQHVVETGSEKKLNKPKQILADLAPQLLGSIQKAPGQLLLPLLGNLEQALEQKEIQAYFTDVNAQKTINTSGWGGSIVTTGPLSDYLFLVNTNLQGQKSDAKMEQTVSHQAVVEEDGSITDTVVITRTHTGTPGEQLYGSTNIDYIRLYAPAGSTLLSATGFTWPDETSFRAPESWYTKDADLASRETEVGIDQASGTRITNEFNKTAFGNWVVTQPGEISRVSFTYRLPFKLITPASPTSTIWEKVLTTFNKPLLQYQLVVQKQSGITSNFESQIIFPTSWQPEWQSGENVVLASNGMRIPASPLTHDAVWGLLMKQTN